MLAYDVIKNCNITRAISIYLDKWADERELANRDETALQIYNFWKMVCELTPEPSPDDILIAKKNYDRYEGITIAAVLYNRDDFEKYLQIIQGKKFPAYSLENSSDELKYIYFESIRGWLPESYDYEWSPWERILGFTVLKENIERNGADAVTAYLFYEMTFDGWTKEVRDEWIEEIAKAISGIVEDIKNDRADDVVERINDDPVEMVEEASENIQEEDDDDHMEEESPSRGERLEGKETWLECLVLSEFTFLEFQQIYREMQESGEA